MPIPSLPFADFLKVPSRVFFLAALLALLVTPCGRSQVSGESYPRAPELTGGNEWLNCSGPVYLKDLRGKVVLLDFWTYCCINCMHVLPDLAKLEERYPNHLVVIGVHSPKFAGEKDSENVRQAVLRYEIEHPVVNDSERRIWKAYDVRMWPTRVLIDPEGNRVRTYKGEGSFAQIESAITGLIHRHRQRKTLDEQPLRFDLAKYRQRQSSPLRFPGKVLADESSNRLFIADSSNHRIVITDLAGRKLDIVGEGRKGHRDGPFDQALFHEPQGMALRGHLLFVADRQNHMIRLLDLRKRTVRTIAGTGRQNPFHRQPGHALRTGLNSPWDLLLEGNTLFIAMAGHHQVWQLDLSNLQLRPFAGDGTEDREDGPRLRSKFAQPTGLASDGRLLFVADSESSSIRAVPLLGDGQVATLIGEGLHEFGDRDGVGNRARLQHCMAVAWHRGKVYVADTYNNKIKVLDPGTRNCRTFLGDGQAGHSDAPARFDEPAGLTVAGDQLYVADTNNHAIRVVDLETRQVRTLQLEGVEAPVLPPKPQPWAADSEPLRVTAMTIPLRGLLHLTVDLGLSDEMQLNPLAPPRCRIEALGEKVRFQEEYRPEKAKSPFTLDLPIDALAGSSELKVSVVYFTCQEGAGGVCRVETRCWIVPLQFDAAAKTAALILSSR